MVMDLVRGGSLEERRARFGDAEWSAPLLAGIARVFAFGVMACEMLAHWGGSSP